MTLSFIYLSLYVHNNTLKCTIIKIYRFFNFHLCTYHLSLMVHNTTWRFKRKSKYKSKRYIWTVKEYFFLQAECFNIHLLKLCSFISTYYVTSQSVTNYVFITRKKLFKEEKARIIHMWWPCRSKVYHKTYPQIIILGYTLRDDSFAWYD